MKKFWDWMDEKDYGFERNGNERLIAHYDVDRKTTIFIKKQMLIGYMIEYMSDNFKMETITYGHAIPIEELYNDLKLRIEEIK